MITALFALLASLSFLFAPAMDTDPAPLKTAATASASWDADTSTDAPALDCTPYVIPETDAGYAYAQELQAQGWTGDPTDHMEALYAPGC